MSAYYNENDPKIATWLRQLIADGLVAPGVVDERSILEVKSHELTEYTQCHFFAGIGGWSYALRLAGWPDDKPVYTGSCPCQPFSQAGQRKVDSDERHLWPAFRTAISERRPSVVFGEQVASKDGRIWLAGVRADLEALGYAVGAADLCAAGVSAPHARQRLYWVAHTNDRGRKSRNTETRSPAATALVGQPSASASRLAVATRKQVGRTRQPRQLSNGRVAHTVEPDAHGRASGRQQQIHHVGAAPFWSDYELIWCSDEKWRRLEPGTFPLAHGVPARMGRLRGYGNAIVPELAAEFIQAYLETQTQG